MRLEFFASIRINSVKAKSETFMVYRHGESPQGPGDRGVGERRDRRKIEWKPTPPTLLLSK